MSAQEDISEIAAQQGWTIETQRLLLCTYIDNLDLWFDMVPDDHFRKWLENKADWENRIAEEG